MSQTKTLRQAAAAAPVPPHNLEAEESVLGACLLSANATAAVVEELEPRDFYHPANAAVFAMVVDLFGRGLPVDAVTVGQELARRPGVELTASQNGDRPSAIKLELFKLVQAVPTPGSAAHYAKIVKETASLRRLAEAAQQISAIAYGMPTDVAGAVSQAEELILGSLGSGGGSDPEPAKDLVADLLNMAEEVQTGATELGKPTGFQDLDQLTGGLAGLVLIAARPSMGKTSLLLEIARHIAKSAPVVFFSLEMSKRELMARLLCSEARVDSHRLRNGTLSDSHWSALSHAAGVVGDLPLYIDDTAQLNPLQARAKCRRIMSRAGRLGLVVVDYIQLMEPTRRSENRVTEVSDISRSLKVLQRELDVPVVAAAQLSRNVEGRVDKRPILSDLRESGSLEQDADIVAFLYRDELYDRNSADAGIAEVIVRKHRNGPVGTVRLGFSAATTSFHNVLQASR